MSASQLYDTWFRRIRKLLTNERITRVRNLTWLLVGLQLGQRIQLSAIMSKLPFVAKLPSRVQRLSRFLQSEAFQVRAWYRPIAEKLLAEAADHGAVRLLVDGTKVGAKHQLLMVALAYRHRALPIAWCWVNGARGHCSAQQQCHLLTDVHALLPSTAHVELAGDCEFGAVAVLQQLQTWHWHYVLRQKGNTQVCVATSRTWCSFKDLVTAKGQPFWYLHGLLTQHLFHTALLAYWAPGENRPWLLATNLSHPTATLHLYRHRMWIEEMFGDWKRHGVDIETTHLCHEACLSRITFAVALWYLWLVTRGVQAIKAGQRHLVDRRSRRDLSVFRIGLYLINRCCARSNPFTIHLIPYF